MNQLEIFCVTNKQVPQLEKTKYKLAAVGMNKFSDIYLTCDTGDNIFDKEKYYSELTFHYWYWKNLCAKNSKNWIGFCQRRRFFIKPEIPESEININNLNKYIITEPENDWDKYNSIICSPICVSGAKKIKLLKRGWKNIVKNPSIFFNKNKETIALHFDMHHGYGNLNLAIDLLDIEDKDEFKFFVNTENKYNPHTMFIARPEILNKWFSTLFPWLQRCEKKFMLEKLKGYDTTRILAYLAERYLSFWFRKYTKFKENSWIFINH